MPRDPLHFRARLIYAALFRGATAVAATLTLITALLALTHGSAAPALAATTLNVNTTADNTTSDGFCSLREALSYTNGAPANSNCGANNGSPYTINV